MNSGICACVLLAVLSSTCLARPSAGTEGDGSPTAAQLDQSASVLNRNVRSAPINAQLRPFLKTDGTAQQRAGIGSLLSKYIKQMMKAVKICTSCGKAVLASCQFRRKKSAKRHDVQVVHEGSLGLPQQHQTQSRRKDEMALR
ncbi:CCKN protein, partial [Polypterus senegalus]